jgi:hypothetical protein
MPTIEYILINKKTGEKGSTYRYSIMKNVLGNDDYQIIQKNLLMGKETEIQP